MLLVLCVILSGLAFEYINGFHDTANAIATVVSTRVLSPRQAVLLAAACNLLGAFWGTAVAATIGNGLIESGAVDSATFLNALLCALLAAVAWNLLTWWLGLPSSSSHALIGGLCGATVASSAGGFDSILWSESVVPKVIVPMITSPVIGLLIGFLVMGLLLVVLRNWRPARVNATFGKLQLLSASLMGLSHGTNDAQKTMGIMALTVFTATRTGAFDDLPGMLGFLRTPDFEVHAWVKLVCSITMAAGTAAGGWRIIKTLGHRMVKLQPIHGFAAETTAAMVIHLATFWGIPLSTTHVISSAIMGVGATRRLNAVKWTVVGRMVWAWLLTLPATGLLGYVLYLCLGPG